MITVRRLRSLLRETIDDGDAGLPFLTPCPPDAYAALERAASSLGVKIGYDVARTLQDGLGEMGIMGDAWDGDGDGRMHDDDGTPLGYFGYNIGDPNSFYRLLTWDPMNAALCYEPPHDYARLITIEVMRRA